MVRLYSPRKHLAILGGVEIVKYKLSEVTGQWLGATVVHVKLIHTHPEGNTIGVCYGVLRRYRDVFTN